MSLKSGDTIPLLVNEDVIGAFDTQISELEICDGVLTARVRNLTLYPPHAFNSNRYSSITVVEGILKFEGVRSSIRVLSPLKDDWKSRIGSDQFDAPIRVVDLDSVEVATSSAVELDLDQMGYCIHENRPCSIDEWRITAENASITVERLRSQIRRFKQLL